MENEKEQIQAFAVTDKSQWTGKEERVLFTIKCTRSEVRGVVAKMNDTLGRITSMNSDMRPRVMNPGCLGSEFIISYYPLQMGTFENVEEFEQYTEDMVMKRAKTLAERSLYENWNNKYYHDHEL